jgi:hypothetical protein
MKIYVAGAWIEQHQRARPMMARLRERGLTITHDWSQPEGKVCLCGLKRNEHGKNTRDASAGAHGCKGFNGCGPITDADVDDFTRTEHANLNLDGVLSANIVWQLAGNGIGNWVELGAALTARRMRESGIIVVSGPIHRKTIFTSLADVCFATDEEAFAYVCAKARTLQGYPA